MITRRNYGHGTWIDQASPWGTFVAAGVLCSDGVVRRVQRIASTADTFYSVPASVQVKGRTVSGYITFETYDGWSVASPDDPVVVKFVANRYGKNHDALPRLAFKGNMHVNT